MENILKVFFFHGTEKSRRNERMRIVYRQCVCILNHFFEKSFRDYAYTDTKVAERAYENHGSNAYVRNIYGLFP